MDGFNRSEIEGATYVISNWLFLRFLGIIYFCAFLSLAVQLKGLIGRKGVSPATEFLAAQRKLWGPRRFLVFPTLCWWNGEDGFLSALAVAGMLLSAALAIGIAPLPVLVLLWLLYLSLYVVGQVFLGYQWDVLLLETGFLAIFVAPWRWLPEWPPASEPSVVARWLLYWLLFRLMFSSGYVKWRRGDPTWRGLTAMQVHYETQPLPSPLAWYAHQLPCSFQKLSTALVLVIEIIVPFLILGPPATRHIAGAAFIALMVLIMASGNYCFFNLITIGLCFWLFEDATWQPLFELISGGKTLPAPQPTFWPWWLLLLPALLVIVLSIGRVRRMFRWEGRCFAPLETFCGWFESICLVNTYGLFSMMTTRRLEIILQGSQDGVSWLDYEFKWKPGDVRRRPRWVAPHQPRLDWQMWFAAFGRYEANPWFIALLLRLLQGSPPVLRLFQTNPFPDAPPQYVRAVLFEYHFTDWKTRRQTGAWWRRERKWLYSPVLSLRGCEDHLMPPRDF